MGEDIDGEFANDWSGQSISLSSDGTIIAIGARMNDGTGTNNNSGHVRVYQFDNSTWTKLGDDINGDSANEYSGWSVSLSSSGSIVAVGAPTSTSGTGKVRVFETGNPNTTQTTYLPIPPDVTSLTIASNNSNSQVAILGDEITLSFEYDMAINTPIAVSYTHLTLPTKA